MTFSRQALPVDFVPGTQTVIVGKGKRFFKHQGNQMLRDIAASKIDEYAAAKTKIDKSEIISGVVDLVCSSYGGYVKRDAASGRWLLAEELLCREKTSGVFREALQSFRKSQYNGGLSKIAKNTKKRQDKTLQISDLITPDSFKVAPCIDISSMRTVFASFELFHQSDASGDLSFVFEGFEQDNDDISLSGISISFEGLEADTNDPHFFELPEF